MNHYIHCNFLGFEARLGMVICEKAIYLWCFDEIWDLRLQALMVRGRHWFFEVPQSHLIVVESVPTPMSFPRLSCSKKRWPESQLRVISFNNNNTILLFNSENGLVEFCHLTFNSDVVVLWMQCKLRTMNSNSL